MFRDVRDNVISHYKTSLKITILSSAWGNNCQILIPTIDCESVSLMIPCFRSCMISFNYGDIHTAPSKAIENEEMLVRKTHDTLFFTGENILWNFGTFCLFFSLS